MDSFGGDDHLSNVSDHEISLSIPAAQGAPSGERSFLGLAPYFSDSDENSLSARIGASPQSILNSAQQVLDDNSPDSNWNKHSSMIAESLKGEEELVAVVKEWEDEQWEDIQVIDTSQEVYSSPAALLKSNKFKTYKDFLKSPVNSLLAFKSSTVTRRMRRRIVDDLTSPKKSPPFSKGNGALEKIPLYKPSVSNIPLLKNVSMSVPADGAVNNMTRSSAGPDLFFNAVSPTTSIRESVKKLSKPTVRGPGGVSKDSTPVYDPMKVANESVEVEHHLQSSFWVRRIFGATFEEYLDAAAALVGDDNVIAFNAENRSKIEISVATPQLNDKIIQSGLQIGDKWVKAYRLSEKPVQLTLRDVPHYIPHQNVCDALKEVGHCTPADCDYVFAPVNRQAIKHIKASRRKVWVRMRQDDTVPWAITVDYGGTAFPVTVSNDVLKCFNCGNVGHFSRNCRTKSVPKVPQGTVGGTSRFEAKEKSTTLTSASEINTWRAPPTYGASPASFSSMGPRRTWSQVASSGTRSDVNETLAQVVHGTGKAALPQEEKAETVTASQRNSEGSRRKGTDSNYKIDRLVKAANDWRDEVKLVGHTKHAPSKSLPEKKDTPSHGKAVTKAKLPPVKSYGHSQEEFFQLTCFIREAEQYRLAKGDYPQARLVELDLEKALEIFSDYKSEFEKETEFNEIGMFFGAVQQVQQMQVDRRRNATKRSAHSSSTDEPPPVGLPQRVKVQRSSKGANKIKRTD